MHTSTSTPTKAEEARFQLLEKLGCVVTWVYFRIYSPADMDHLKSGNRRIGHMDTIPLTPWYHRGVTPYCRFKRRPLTQKEARKLFGPSRALEPRAFHERFGPNAELLDMTNQLIARMQ